MAARSSGSFEQLFLDLDLHFADAIIVKKFSFINCLLINFIRPFKASLTLKKFLIIVYLYDINT